MDFESLKSSLEKYGQEHLLQFWDTLSEEDRQKLSSDIKGIDFDEITKYYKQSASTLNEEIQKVDDIMQPLAKEQYGSVTRTDEKTLKSYSEEGLRLISEGKVGTLLLAGGQGTRLGVNYPKGMYDIGLPSGKTLFQIQAERIKRLEDLSFDLTGVKGHIPWYIMTSFATKGKTMEFFEKNDYFSLKKENITVFEQGMLPCYTNDGKLILEKPYKIASAPDGNGGLYRAIKQQKVLEDMEARGVTCVHVYGVDNILVKVADPVFIGYSSLKGSDCGAKVVEKAFPTEAVGVICNVGNKCKVVEYSEITLKTAQKRNADGRLVFGAGNICNHYFTTEFLRKVIHEFELPHHVAKKKIPHAAANGETVKPDKPNGLKLEKFVFDIFELAENFVAWEVLREDEFSPLKNADGAEKDTPTTARHSVYNLHQRYVLQAGGKFVDENGEEIPLIPSVCDSQNGSVNGSVNGSHTQNGDTTSSQTSNSKYRLPVVCEISPLVSYAGEDLVRLVSEKAIMPPFHLQTTTEVKSVHVNGTNGTNGTSGSNGVNGGIIAV
ncbi:UDP-N-acetylhexosamine pyrophosphorylase [Nymphon striatum]|nr:UDP-N-acetylhexosamine pyrophosphorylase [Nymphon striatum]